MMGKGIEAVCVEGGREIGYDVSNPTVFLK